MIKKGKIFCKDLNLTDSHACEKEFEFDVDEQNIKESVVTLSPQIKSHLRDIVDEETLTKINEDLVEKIIIASASKVRLV